MSHPLAYFLTWSTYGSHLRGDERGWAERRASAQSPIRAGDPGLNDFDAQHLHVAPVTLSPRAREVVAQVVGEVCAHRGWKPYAVNPRTQHIHVVLCSPERAMNDLKAWCTRRLRESDLVGEGPVWTQHGSTRYLNDAESLAKAVWYVVEEQD